MKNILYKTLAVVFALQIPASYIVWQADNPADNRTGGG